MSLATVKGRAFESVQDVLLDLGEILHCGCTGEDRGVSGREGPIGTLAGNVVGANNPSVAAGRQARVREVSCGGGHPCWCLGDRAGLVTIIHSGVGGRDAAQYLTCLFLEIDPWDCHVLET